MLLSLHKHKQVLQPCVVQLNCSEEINLKSLFRGLSSLGCSLKELSTSEGAFETTSGLNSYLKVNTSTAAGTNWGEPYANSIFSPEAGVFVKDIAVSPPTYNPKP